MSAEKFSQNEEIYSNDHRILKQIRNRADDLINLGFLQTRLWMVTTGITIIAATYGIEFSGDMIKRFRERQKDKKK